MSLKNLLQKNFGEAYQWLIEHKIRKKHTHGDEISKLRKEIAHIEAALDIEPTEEFAAYHTECEKIKNETREELDNE